MQTDLMDTVISWYQEPLFIQFPVITFAIGIGAFVLLAAPWTLLALLDPDWAKPYRVQNKDFEVPKFLSKNIYLIIFNSLLVFALLLLAFVYTGQNVNLGLIQ